MSIDGLLLRDDVSLASAYKHEATGSKSDGGDEDGGEEKEMKGMVLHGLPFEGNVRIGKKSL